MEMDRMVVLAIGLVVAAVPSSSPRESPATAARPPALSGRWRINLEKSDDAGEKLRAAGSGRPGRSGAGGPGPGSGFGGGRGGRMGGGRGGGQGDPRQSIRDLLESPTEVTITHTDAEIAVVEKDGRLRILHPDGESYRDSAGNQVKARWELDRLVVETRTPAGPKLTETLTLTNDPRQLMVEVRFESTFLGPVTLRRVYDAEAPE